MTDAPETIWVGPNTSEQWDFGDWDLTGDGIVYAEHAAPYIRADLSDARVAQAREDALREAAAIKLDVEVRSDCWRHAALDTEEAYRKAILALITKDADNG